MLCGSGKSCSFLPLHVPRAPLRIWGYWDPWGTVGENRLLRGQGGRDLPVATCLPQPGCWGSGQVRQVVCKGETPHPRSEASPSQDPIPLSWDFGAWVEGDLGDFAHIRTVGATAAPLFGRGCRSGPRLSAGLPPTLLPRPQLGAQREATHPSGLMIAQATGYRCRGAEALGQWTPAWPSLPPAST